MEWTFVLKDKGTSNQGWWLKLGSIQELEEYIKITNPTVYGNVFENYIYSKDYNDFKPRKNPTYSHSPHPDETSLTYAVCSHAARQHTNIINGIMSFAYESAMHKLQTIETYGCIFINENGGCHADYDGEHQYEFVRKSELVFPDFKKQDIRIRQFPGGTHFYAYIGKTQVRDGDTLKWNTYEEAYKQALHYL